MTLERRWRETMRALGAPPADGVFRDLVTRWSEAHRRYHALSHLEHCLREIDTLPFEAKPVAELAAWFHDAIYVTRPGAENERKSAELARAKLGPLGVDPEPVCVMVLATEQHASTATRDGDLFLDVDMCILGQDDDVYDAYDAGVREEWGWVPDDVFAEKRAEFLNGLLARPVIFLSPEMRGRYELRARENIARSLAKLR